MDNNRAVFIMAGYDLSLGMERYVERFYYYAQHSSTSFLPLLPELLQREMANFAKQLEIGEVAVQNAFSELVTWAEADHFVKNNRYGCFFSTLVLNRNFIQGPTGFQTRYSSVANFMDNRRKVHVVSYYKVRDVTQGHRCSYQAEED